MIKIKKALLSVSDKTNLVQLGNFLQKYEVELISTGGTLKELQKNNIQVVSIDSFTGFPEMLEGRVKTLHPKVHAGLLADPDREAQKKDIEIHGITSIDLVVVNLYPFSKTIQKPDATLEEAIENIDIGGPTMLRSGAKNYRHTVVLTDISDYEKIQREMEETGGFVREETSFYLAKKVFSLTAQYDTAISNYFSSRENEKFPEILNLSFIKRKELRYGENPHQRAAYYAPSNSKGDLEPIQGKELSFNNMLDFDAAIQIATLLPKNTVSIIKHLNPCGIGSGSTPLESYNLALRTDPISAFGGVIGVGGLVDGELARKITEIFVEGVIAESFSKEALDVFSKKPNVRILSLENFLISQNSMDLRPIIHGLLLQDRDLQIVTEKDLKVVSSKKPSDEDTKSLLFAWNCVKCIKSNAIVYTDKNSTLGIGAGQMSRVDSVELGAAKAKKVGLSLAGSFVGSDAFFPFRDGVDALAREGVRAIIQPGGSIKDEEVIQAADEHGIIMVFTGMRHFRH